MSRIGKLPILLPTKVEAKLNTNNLEIKGPFGTLQILIPPELEVQLTEKEISVIKKQESRSAKQKHGLTRSLINNMVIGVSEKFERKLELIGVGYRASVQGKTLVLNVGYSHPVEFTIPDGIEAKVEGNTNLLIQGIDKEQVGLFSSKIRDVRPPEPYKGKGIRYNDEVVLRKAGKSGK